jgi:hypothetical protein
VSDLEILWKLLCDRVLGPFFFTESTITGDIYLDLLQLYVFPQIEDVKRNWEPGHFHAERSTSLFQPACAWSLE